MSEKTELLPEKHVCGQCQEEFETEDQYLDHECPATGFTPRDPEHLGDDFKAVSEAALARGAAQQEKEADDTVSEK